MAGACSCCVATGTWHDHLHHRRRLLHLHLHLLRPGYEIPEEGCIAVATEEGDKYKEQQVKLKELIASVADQMSAEEARNPIYRCINGTTMKDLFLTFVVLFLYRIALGFFVRYLIVPLKVRWSILKEEVSMRARVQAKAMNRLVQAKLVMNKYFKSNIAQIQQTAPASAQDSLTRKLSNILESENAERERIQAITRRSGIVGLVQGILAFFENRRRKRQEALEEKDAAEAGAHGVNVASMLDDHTEQLQLSAQTRQKREMEKAVRTISFDCSQQGLECKVRAPPPARSSCLLPCALCFGLPAET